MSVPGAAEDDLRHEPSSANARRTAKSLARDATAGAVAVWLAHASGHPSRSARRTSRAPGPRPRLEGCSEPGCDWSAACGRQWPLAPGGTAAIPPCPVGGRSRGGRQRPLRVYARRAITARAMSDDEGFVPTIAAPLSDAQPPMRLERDERSRDEATVSARTMPHSAQVCNGGDERSPASAQLARLAAAFPAVKHHLTALHPARALTGFAFSEQPGDCGYVRERGALLHDVPLEVPQRGWFVAAVALLPVETDEGEREVERQHLLGRSTSRTSAGANGARRSTRPASQPRRGSMTSGRRLRPTLSRPGSRCSSSPGSWAPARR